MIGFKPILSRVLVEVNYEKTIGGIFLPPDIPRDIKTLMAKVLAIGPEVKDVKVGENVLIQDYGTEVDVDGRKCKVILENVIYAVLEDK